MSSKTLHIAGENELDALAARLAPHLHAGDVVVLQGDLGAGKTAFSRAFINVLSAAPQEVPSPTFTLVQVYDDMEPPVWHFDLYRIEHQDDILELGWDEARRQGISLVEWPERLGSLLPKDRLEINIRFIKDSENSRQIILTPYGRWADRFERIAF